MGYNQFDTSAVVANINAIDEAFPGSMKKAAMVCALAEIVIGQQPRAFDPVPQIPYVRYTDELLPGSMKDAAIVYMLAQAAYGPHILDAGVATLVGGAVVVLSASADAASPILLTPQNANPASILRVSAIVDGVSFTISSSSGIDTSKVSWAIL